MGDMDEDDMDDADFVGNDYGLDSVSGDDEYDDELYENFVDDVSAEMDSADETNSESSGDVVVSDNDMDEHRLSEDDDNEHNFPVFNPVEIDVKGWRVDIMNQLRCHVSRDQAYRAKRQALKKLEGSPEHQFSKLWDYAEELRRTNPGSTVILGVNDVNGENRDPIRVFYLLLGVDPNNNLYPIAYSVVQRESRDTWEWFLTVLKQDLCIQRDNEYTFMGLAYKNALWKAARASTVGEFKLRMEEMKQLNQDAFDWFNDKPPSEWNTIRFHAMMGSQFSVDLEMRTCTCRIWQLSGIPCKHACSAIFNQNLQPEDMVHPYYNVETYKQVYEPAILPISGETLWTETGFIPPLPPNFGRGSGRPAGARNREPDEPNVKTAKKIGKKPVKLRRQKVKHHGKICGEEGHNAKRCALWEDMQEPGIDEEMNMTAAASGVNDQPPILPPITEESEPTEPELTPDVLTEAGPSQTQASVQGPSMYEQLQMGNTSQTQASVQPQMILQPRLNIRAPPPMTGTGVMPCFSSRPLIPVSKTIIKEHGKKFVDLSKWPSQSAKDGKK
ncbi:UNVERIFIED_CONTAM: hypothetical protein Slati_1759800 [Sesamum latifolium]|uniref:SWIM-type domain-containing protein n=1 Tax=Sesamum latifolium TaxID=2727402 RepID=A0AAW2WXJ9_9LAMI